MLQHRVLGKGHQLGSLGKLGAFFCPVLGNKQAGGRAHVINNSDHCEENGEDEHGSDEEGTVESSYEDDPLTPTIYRYDWFEIIIRTNVVQSY